MAILFALIYHTAIACTLQKTRLKKYVFARGVVAAENPLGLCYWDCKHTYLQAILKTYLLLWPEKTMQTNGPFLEQKYVEQEAILSQVSYRYRICINLQLALFVQIKSVIYRKIKAQQLMNCLDSSQVVTFFYLLYYLQKFSRTDVKKDFLRMYLWFSFIMLQFH